MEGHLFKDASTHHRFLITAPEFSVQDFICTGGAAYDNNGNTTSKTDSTGTTNYTWDFENRLSSVTLPGSGGTVSFKYDPFGRRIYKSSSTGTSIFAYDGERLLEETNTSGAVVARYAQGENIDEPLAMLRSGATSYYENDGLGSITSLTSGSGSIVESYTFDSFGKTTASTGSVTNPFQYTGREFDQETGLYFYRARYYDPTSGRFLSEDPIGFGGGRNFYNYALGDPTNFSDPTGLLSLCTRPVRFFKWLGDLGACHGFLKLTDGTTIGGYNRNGKLVPNKDDDDDKKDPNHLKETKCTDIPNSECLDNKVRQAYNDLKKQFDQYRDATGSYPLYGVETGVSTGVAQTVLDNAGLRYKFPLRCFGWLSGNVPLIPGPSSEPPPWRYMF
jgi:RHS repeat-associated protein